MGVGGRAGNLDAIHRMSMNGGQRPTHLDLRNVPSMTNDHNMFNMPKLDTSDATLDFDALHTGPPLTSFGGFDLDQLFTPGGNTVNPAQLHFGGAVTSPPSNIMPTYPPFPFSGGGIDMIEDDFSWIRNWDGQIHDPANENAIDESSPSRFSSNASQSGFSEAVGDNSNGAALMKWHSHDPSAQAVLTPGALNFDTLGTGLTHPDASPAQIAPNHLQHSSTSIEPYFDTIMAQHGLLDHHSSNGMQFNFSGPAFQVFDPDSPSVSSASLNSSARHSSITTMSSDSITDATRQAMLLSLSKNSGLATQRRYTSPSISSPLSSHNVTQGPNLPSTADLQRYVNSYMQFFHPHLPFLHISTLSFDSIDFVSSMRPTSGHGNAGNAGMVGGGGCLILAMAAIGALHEYEHVASKALFDSAKKMISSYLDGRRKADLQNVNGQQSFSQDGSAHHTPLWLVQAMLLNVVYGHFSGDKTAADIASTHCAALVSLAKAADLASPSSKDTSNIKREAGQSPGAQASYMKAQWLRWKEKEERKRTFFAVFILSTLLVTAYNQPPAIMNSEVLLELPCEEDLWTAENYQDWIARGGLNAGNGNGMLFETALLTLLHPNQRHLQQGGQLVPSTFGCLVLINALHNYIWETRSRHNGRQWTAQETESMFSHIEPALNAWQRAWKANGHHTLERPNPSGRGPLAADSIPLLDLAFVRLFVNLGRSREAFWMRDFDLMSNEMARGVEIVQHADCAPDSRENIRSSHSPAMLDLPEASHPHRRQSQTSAAQTSKRERHLRKAAFYAADSLLIASKFNLTFADPTAHELPIQSAMCFFDCSQVLAEWVSTVQERVGRYLGIIGQSDIDYTQVPAIMLLETEDVELLGKIQHICTKMEEKMISHASMLSALDPSTNGGLDSIGRLPGLDNCGLGSRILKIVGLMLEKAAVWPGTFLASSHSKRHANKASTSDSRHGQRFRGPG